jgi:hypothetical protein
MRRSGAEIWSQLIIPRHAARGWEAATQERRPFTSKIGLPCCQRRTEQLEAMFYEDRIQAGKVRYGAGRNRCGRRSCSCFRPGRSRWDGGASGFGSGAELDVFGQPEAGMGFEGRAVGAGGEVAGEKQGQLPHSSQQKALNGLPARMELYVRRGQAAQIRFLQQKAGRDRALKRVAARATL